MLFFLNPFHLQNFPFSGIALASKIHSSGKFLSVTLCCFKIRVMPYMMDTLSV